MGRLLQVDLESGRWRLSPVPPDVAQRFLGGRGTGVHFILRALASSTRALDPQSPLVFSCGLLTGTAAPSSSRLHINALSPLTGLLGSANVGGDFGARLRACGIQTVIVRGRAREPVWLLITPAGAALRSADRLWSCDTWETDERIKTVLGDESVQSLVIGPAGENQVPLACIVSDKDHAAGRTGLGAVMGAKHLKAIVVQPAVKTVRASTAGERTAVQEYAFQIRNASDFRAFKTYGGAGWVKWCDSMGFAATRNFRSGRFEAIDRIDGRRLKKHVHRSRGCRRCPVRCKAELNFVASDGHRTQYLRPEFEPLLNLGAKCALPDLEAVVRLDNLCTRLGIDAISTAAVMAFIMDLSERGLLVAPCPGLDLKWGDAAAMEALLQQMARAEGFGKLLGQGVRAAARQIGGQAQRYAAHVKGLELPAYHPGYVMGTALGYAVSSRGGDFNNVYASLEYSWKPERAAEAFGNPGASDVRQTVGKGLVLQRATLVNLVLDCLGLCKVPALSLIGAFDLQAEADLTTALTGKPTTPADLFAVGARLANLERVFNLGRGFSPRDDRLPEMFYQAHTRQSGPSPLTRAGFEGMRREYYHAMGWDDEGRPLAQTLDALGIDRL